MPVLKRYWAVIECLNPHAAECFCQILIKRLGLPPESVYVMEAQRDTKHDYSEKVNEVVSTLKKEIEGL